MKVALSFAALLATATTMVQGCSRCLYVSKNGTVLATRSMDWIEDTKTDLWAFPAGIKRNGGTGANTPEWTSKYGSLIASGYDMTVDGINEKGLITNILYLSESEYPEPQGKPTLLIGLWAQYVLDNFANVTEVVEDFEKDSFRLVAPPLPVAGHEEGAPASLHLSISDADGDSAIFEYLDNQLVIHHGKQYQVMTNDPRYDEQLKIAKSWEKVDGMKSIPGTVLPEDRFVRLSYYNSVLPKGENTTYRDMVAGTMSVMRQVSVPFGIAMEGYPNICSTRWRVLADSTNKAYYYDSATNPNVFWVPLSDLDLSVGAPVKMLDVASGKTYNGNTASLFVEAEPFKVFGTTA